MYRNFQDLFEMAEQQQVPLYRIILENEMRIGAKTESEIYAELAERWSVMQNSAHKALDQPQKMPGGLIEGQARRQQLYHSKDSYSGETINLLMAMAFSGSEVNASMGRICAAPTAGACGILPAVLLTASRQKGSTQLEILNALLVAGGVGAIITKNATVSGAEGGCQAECGSAAAMAAAAAVTLAEGKPYMVGNAISIAFMNCMGLVCDPVAGLVQLPCSFRNASQAVNALISADMALAGQDAVIPADQVVKAMLQVGKKLPVELRETALGGIAATSRAKELAGEF